MLAGAVGENEVAHVFDHAQHRDAELLKHLRGANGVVLRHFLRRADHHRAGQRQQLRHRQRHVARPGGKVDDEVVQVAPAGLRRQLLERPVRHRPPPDQRLLLIHQRADRPVEPYLRQLALVRGGIYGHRKFAEGRQLPLPAEMLNALPFIMPLAASAQEAEMLRLFDRYGIRPRRVIGHTQYYDVMAAMLERGVGVSSFADAILPTEMREQVIMLHPLENWRLLWYRKDAGGDPRCDAVQAFLVSSVLRDFPDDVASHLGGFCPSERAHIPPPKIVDIVDGVVTWDMKQETKRPDWTYA